MGGKKIVFLCILFFKQLFCVFKQIIFAIFFWYFLFLIMAVPPNLFFGLRVQDPISGLHMYTFGCNILNKCPLKRLLRIDREIKNNNKIHCFFDNELKMVFFVCFF